MSFPADDTTPFEPPRRFHFDWLMPALLTPRAFFGRLAHQNHASWLTPMLVLSGLAVARAALNSQLTPLGQIVTPPDFQYWMPEMQQQFMQNQQALQGPLFRFGFPILGTLGGVWLGWVITFAALNLLVTLNGGRGGAQAAVNFVAWASLPLAAREAVRLVYLLAANAPITTSGLAGFGPEGAGWPAFITQMLALTDAFVIWHWVLLTLAVMAVDKFSLPKAALVTFLALALTLAALALPNFIGVQLSAMRF